MRQPKNILSLMLIVSLAFSCVSKKELTYFQSISQPKEYNVADSVPILRPGDVLNISISTLPTSQINTYSNADINNNSIPIINGYTISEAGTIQLPVIGKVTAIGKTVDQVREEIIELVGEYFQNASVKVHLLSFTISVLGEVARPGQHTIYNRQASLLDGLALGGDMLPSADRNAVYLIRTQEGVATRYPIDLQQDDLFTAPYFYLQPNDIIYVEPARYRSINPLQPWAIAISSLSVLAIILNIFID